jgi:tRNA dimethylallyltransferase
MEQLIAIVGPTASGKTGLAVELARRQNGEVISADSRQVYRGLDIGTEKVTTREMRGIPHHCIDIASPRRAFSVEQWRNHAEKAVRSITRRGKLLIVAGGTGLYVDTLVYGTQFPPVKPNAALRKRLATKTPAELFAELEALDPVRASNIERENPRRLMRAIEVATELGSVPVLGEQTPKYDAQWIGLFPGMAVLEERIESRLDSTIRKGLVAETRKLREDGLSWKRIDELGLEYRIVASHIRGEITKDEMRALMLQELRKYAKRQMRWLKRNKDITWYANAAEALADLQ